MQATRHAANIETTTCFGVRQIMNNEMKQALAESDLARSENPPKLSVHQLFEFEVEKSPESIAIVHCGERITYAELNKRANRIAHHLVSVGIGTETLVALVMERSPNLIASILGILKAGGAYLPLDPDYPQERLAMMIEDANAPVLLTETSMLKRLSANGSMTICIDNIEFDAENSDNPNIATGPDNLAYVMFTSGSTGRPKGVMIEHRSIVRLVKGADYADFSADNVFLQFAPITFDASTFEIWGALLNGARLAIMPEGIPSLADLGPLSGSRQGCST
jgi:non-ribosomal peptide synthetase component F